MSNVTHVYRYQLMHDTDPVTQQHTVTIWAMELTVLRETPGGYWFHHPTTYKEKFVRKDAHKSYAYDDRFKAWDNFVRRVNGWEWVLRDTLSFVERGQEVINKYKINQQLPKP